MAAIIVIQHRYSSSRNTRPTCASHRSDGVLIECESCFNGLGSHVLIEHITASEVKCATVVLVLWNDTDINPTE